MPDRKNHLNKLKAQLESWMVKVDELQGRAGGADLEKRIECNREIAGMYGKIKFIELTMKELEAKDPEPNDNRVQQIRGRMDELDRDFSKTAARLE